MLAAAARGFGKACAEALSGGADPRAADESGQTPLMLAARGGHAKVAKALLALSDPLAADLTGWVALSHACKGGSLECVELLACEAAARAKTLTGWTPLAIAAMNGRDRCLPPLMPFGHLGRDCWGEDPLTQAIRHGHLECARVLATPEACAARDANGHGALVHAARLRQWDCVRLLLPIDASQAGLAIKQADLMGWGGVLQELLAAFEMGEIAAASPAPSLAMGSPLRI